MTWLLLIIYLAFISLGLPDSLIGSAWPKMQGDLNVPSSYAGIVTMTVAFGTIVSSLSSDWLTKKIRPWLVISISVLLTAVGLLGFSLAEAFWQLLLWAVPYGLGAGAIDAALNNYVALHYSSRHMNWLHCCWGIGASISPYLMSYSLETFQSWARGFRLVFYIQIGIALIMFLSFPLWKKAEKEPAGLKSENKPPEEAKEEKMNIFLALKIPGVLLVLFAFFSYCALESTAGLWAATYLVSFRGVDKVSAARFASFFYLGITLGRGIDGFIAGKFSDKNMIRIGLSILSLGLLFTGLPLQDPSLALAGLIVIGLGCAPIYPAVIHATPFNFGASSSQAIIGIEMAAAYLGSTFMPPLFGLLTNAVSVGYYPLYLAFFALMMIVLTEWLNFVLKKNKKAKEAKTSERL